MDSTNINDEEKMEKTNAFAEFYNSRTTIWRSLLFLSIESLIPGVAFWLLCGIDIKSTSMANHFPSPHAGWATLIGVGYLILTTVLTIVCFYLKGHEADNFTYSITLSIIIAALTILSYGLDNHITFIFVKFIVAFALIILGGICGVFLTALFNNFSLKRSEQKIDILKKYDEGEELSQREQKLLTKYQQFLQKKEFHKKQSDELNKKLDEKLKKLLDEKEANEKNED